MTYEDAKKESLLVSNGSPKGNRQACSTSRRKAVWRFDRLWDVMQNCMNHSKAYWQVIADTIKLKKHAWSLTWWTGIYHSRTGVHLVHQNSPQYRGEHLVGRRSINISTKEERWNNYNYHENRSSKEAWSFNWSTKSKNPSQNKTTTIQWQM